jgi:UDP-2-acetamido-3-amino-2,3-dideoxy-glucuronate N-acetyltransferase
MKKNIAVVGCGYWGKNLVRNFHDLGVLYAACDSAEEKLDFFKDKYPDLKYFNDFNTLLEDPNISAVAIGTPAATHYDLVKKAMLLGKDVFVEKPISLKYREGEELVDLAEKNKRILMVGHILEYHPAINKLKDMIRKGELGNIQYIYSNRLNLGKFRTEENILWSFAPHDISVIISLLGEIPASVTALGRNSLNKDIADVTITSMSFPSGAKAHIFVSWLHPYKEQKLVVIGGKKMVLFNDTEPENKLICYNHKIDWIKRMPVPRPEEAEPIPIEKKEPLREECSHFLECVLERKKPLTDGHNGLRVLKILQACQESLNTGGNFYQIKDEPKDDYFVHESSYVDENCSIGNGTKIWHFCHVLSRSKIGKNGSIGQNCVIGPNVTIGDNVKIQNNVSVYDGVTLEDDVFCGPSMVFTNVHNPRSHWPRKDEFKKTLVKKGASLGANSTVICGHNVGKYAFVGAGALVTKDVPDYALVYGVPAEIQGWTCYCGIQLDFTNQPDSNEECECANCGRKYKKSNLKIEEIL